MIADAPRTWESRELKFHDGTLMVDPQTGAPIQFVDDENPVRRFLLDLGSDWHSVEHQWGSGFVITDTGSRRWNVPTSLTWSNDSNHAEYDLGTELTLTVDRKWDTAGLTETYTFSNPTQSPLTLNSVGIQTPFNDVYQGARSALESSVHAHVWTGGSWSWVLAQPMSGTGRVLGLHVTRGVLQSYSVESRNPNTLSNARGHIVLQPTDAGRNPTAMSGQVPLEIGAGEEWTLEWLVRWYNSPDDFIEATPRPADFSAFAAPLERDIQVATYQQVWSPTLNVESTDAGAVLRADRPGMHRVHIGADAVTEVLFHSEVRQVTEERVQYILQHQTTPERPGSLSHALVPVNTSTMLTQLTNGWSDWTDGSERIGMAILIQQARARGWVDSSVDSALEGWATFAQEHLLDETAAPRRGSQDHHTGPRLYDSPWLAIFFLLRAEYLQSNGSDAREELELAARILERAYELGAEGFLAILQAEAVALVANALDRAGQQERGAALRSALVASAQHFLNAGTDLPPHEVAYEQTIVAPLVSLFTEAFRITGDATLIPAIAERVAWLEAFGGRQPHARLHEIAIRHWDGYWFGQNRQWGDVFPHYWSSLSAVALLRLPHELLTPTRERRAEAILAGNMANFGHDGWATCAFVFPSTVDSQPASHADPLANDQDWHLVMWLLLDHQALTR